MNLSEKNNIDYDLLAKFFADNTTAAESAAVSSWVNESAENQAQFAELKFLWKDTNAIQNIGKENLPEVDIESALSKIKSQSASTPPSQLTVVKSPNRTLFLRIAAGLAILIGAGLFTFNFLNKEELPLEVFAETKIIEQPLIDGSIVKLNKGAKLTYPKEFTSNKRIVKLEGEAFFNIKPNLEKPFLIHTGNANVEVLGTSFNIKSHSSVDSTLVYVETGKVALYFGDSKVILTKNMTGVFYKKTKKVAILEASVSDHNFWRNRSLDFKRTELKVAVTKLSALYNTKIQLNNKKLATCLVTVKFENKTIEEILDIIALTHNLKVVKKTEGFVLEGNGC